jgi:hypothetical protein
MLIIVLEFHNINLQAFHGTDDDSVEKCTGSLKDVNVSSRRYIFITIIVFVGVIVDPIFYCC